MQLRPEQVCAAPGTTTTFTCSYRAAESLDIEFSTATARGTARGRATPRPRIAASRGAWAP